MKNKNLPVQWRFVWMFLLAAAGLTACKDEEKIKPRTISDVIAQDDRFTILRAVLKQSGMADGLKTNVLTLFAPNDEAFKKMSINDPGAVSGLSGDSLRGIIQYLILDGRRTAAEFPDGVKQRVKMLDGNNLFVTKNQEGFKVNMANVVDTNIVADNGIIHELDHVPSTSNMNLVTWIASNPSFSFFAAAATKAASVNPDLAAKLASDTTSFTLFAPSNQAFVDAGFPTIESVSSTSADILAAILANHILEGAYFSTEFKTGQIGTISGAPLLITADRLITVAGNGNAGALPAITRSDILTRNGVIHILDGVVLP